jgi:hypothetical protein
MLTILEPLGLTGYSVLDGEQPFPDPKAGKKFIKAACEAWFGQSVPEIEAAFGKAGFKNIWQKHVFDAYKGHGGWEGMLALGVKTYQYIVTGDEFSSSMKKKFQGYICKASEKQSRALAPQVFIG